MENSPDDANQKEFETMEIDTFKKSVELESRGTIFSTFRSRFGIPRILAAIFICIVIIVVLAVTAGSRSDSDSSMSSSRWPPPEVVINKEINKQSWDHLETQRPGMIFGSTFLSGVTYMQEFEMEMDQELPIDNQTITSQSFMSINSELSVSDNSGGKQIDVNITHISMTEYTLGVELKYNSDSKAGAKILADSLNPAIGHVTTVMTDKDYNIVSVSEHENKYKATQGAKAKVSSSSQFEQVDRLAMILSTNEVKPGDEWTFEMKMEDKIFSGTAELVGYVIYNEADCAVIRMNGNVVVDMEMLTNAMSEQLEDENMKEKLSSLDIDNGLMSGVIYWDHQQRMPRFAKLFNSLTLLMQNPFDRSDIIAVASEQELTFYIGTRESFIVFDHV